MLFVFPQTAKRRFGACSEWKGTQVSRYNALTFGDFCAGTPGNMGTQQTILLQIDYSLFGCFYVMRVTLLIYKPCSVALALLTCLHLYGSQDAVKPALPSLVATNQLPPPSSADNRYVWL